MASAKKLHYAWIVAGVTFVVLLLTAGIRAAPGVLIVPLESEFHWSRATISFAVAVNLLLYGLIGPFAAAVIDRWGVRRTMTLALAVTAAGDRADPGDAAILAAGAAVGRRCRRRLRRRRQLTSRPLSRRAGSATARGSSSAS